MRAMWSNNMCISVVCRGDFFQEIILLLCFIDSSMRVSQVVKGEMSAKTTYQKSAKGPVSIAECSADGKSVTLENVGRKVSIRPIRFMIISSHRKTW